MIGLPALRAGAMPGAACLVLLVVAAASLASSGCGSGQRFGGAEKEAEEQDRFARENRRERRAAHRRAERLQRGIDAHLVPFGEATASCRVAYRPAPPFHGMIPVACGDFGDVWPLIIDRGYLRCEPSIKKNLWRVVFTAPDGVEYGVNSGAFGVGYPSIGRLLRKDAHGLRVTPRPLVVRGLEICVRGLRQRA
jgi:hypothetical protein